MARVKRGVTAKARHRKILELAEGMQGARHRLYKNANEAVMHSLSYAYRDRKQRKGDMRTPLDRAHQRGGAAERPCLQPVHARAEGSRRRCEPQDARRHRRHGFGVVSAACRSRAGRSHQGVTTDVHSVAAAALEAIAAAQDLAELDAVRARYLGRGDGELTAFRRGLGQDRRS